MINSPRTGLRFLLPLLLLAVSPPLVAELPPASTDGTAATGFLELLFGGGSLGLLHANGTASVRRGDATSSGSGMEIPAELVSLRLSTFEFGSETIVRLSSVNPSRGAIRIPGGGVEIPGEAFFDVWLEIQIPDFGITLTSAEPIPLAGIVGSIPMRHVLASPPGQRFKLLEGGIGSVWEVGLLGINLDPSVVCTDTQAAPGPVSTTMRWTLPEGQEEIALAGRWTFISAFSSTPIPPGALSTHNSELLAMELTGTSQFRGPIRLIERPETISPGEMVFFFSELYPYSYYRSSFRAFFEIHDERGGTYLNVDPLVANGAIFLLEDGTFHQSVEPVKLLDAPGGKTVAVLESLGWEGGQGLDRECCRDADGDGAAPPPCDSDCDDADPNNFPGNTENCADSRDNNCDQRPDCLEAVCQAQLCNDLSQCTLNDVCREFACVGQPRDCNDSNTCTLDRCEPATGVCQHPPIGPPGPAGPVKFTGPDTLEWTPAPEASMSNTYRGRVPAVGGMGSLSAGPYSHTCFESGDAQGNGATRSVDAEEMRPGEIRYYLVSGETVCGESPLGWASDGTVIPNLSSCPSPPP